jgi:hypothetical protein
MRRSPRLLSCTASAVPMAYSLIMWTYLLHLCKAIERHSHATCAPLASPHHKGYRRIYGGSISSFLKRGGTYMMRRAVHVIAVFGLYNVFSSIYAGVVVICMDVSMSFSDISLH